MNLENITFSERQCTAKYHLHEALELAKLIYDQRNHFNGWLRWGVTYKGA